MGVSADEQKNFKQNSAIAVLVPGIVKGLEALHQKYGHMPWKRLFEDCIRLAEEGFEMKQDLYNVRALIRDVWLLIDSEGKSESG